MSICINAILFTIKGKQVKENKYIPIFYMWLSSLIKFGGLTSSDMVYVYVDSITADYLNEDQIFNILKKDAAFKVKSFVFPQPDSIFEGMMKRFIDMGYEQDIYMYCDIDILITNSIHLLSDKLSPNTIAVHPENPLHRSDYCLAFTKEELDRFPSSAVGLSAGKFMIRGKEAHQLLNKITNSLYNPADAPFSMYDQAYYNKAIYIILDQKLCSIDSTLINLSTLSSNGNGLTNQTVLVDTMGIPGDGEFHFDKLLRFYIMKNTGCF